MELHEDTINNDNNRRSNKLRGHLLSTLNNNIRLIQESWTKFSQIKVKNQQFMEELSEILISVNYVKELCTTKGMTLLATQSEELEIALTELIDFPQIGDKLLYQAIILKMSDLSTNINELYQDYLSNESLEILKELEEHKILSPREFRKNHIFIMSTDEKLIEECSNQIRHYGYISEVFNSDSLENTQNNPAAIIVDLDILEERKSINLKDFHIKNPDIPIIVVSSDSDFKSRLTAVQSGSSAFFAKPVNVSSVLDKLDNIIYNIVMAEPPKILVIDDSKTISAFLSRTLTQADMIVHVEMTPESALNVMAKRNIV